jgi:predicted enzyme involved in methoxymalonyl-ACP biosynthesis
MSCRVLKRDMELAMLDALVEHASDRNIRSILGVYIPTAKNGMVRDHYEKLGFTHASTDDATRSTAWSLDVTSYQSRSRHIRILAAARSVVSKPST